MNYRTLCIWTSTTNLLFAATALGYTGTDNLILPVIVARMDFPEPGARWLDLAPGKANASFTRELSRGVRRGTGGRVVFGKRPTLLAVTAPETQLRGQLYPPQLSIKKERYRGLN